ncbi:MAG: hypothetical protein FWC64_11775 [Treponema sp.]|nr:hypothetical protein [Treponema sp.]
MGSIPTPPKNVTPRRRFAVVGINALKAVTLGIETKRSCNNAKAQALTKKPAQWSSPDFLDSELSR